MVKTERVFLMELFLDDELPKKIKLKIKDRFQELEEPQPPLGYYQGSITNHIKESLIPALASQSPSMQRMMAQNPDLIPKAPVPTTPAAAAALAQRQALMNSAGKEEKGSRSPRKA